MTKIFMAYSPKGRDSPSHKKNLGVNNIILKTVDSDILGLVHAMSEEVIFFNIIISALCPCRITANKIRVKFTSINRLICSSYVS